MNWVMALAILIPLSQLKAWDQNYRLGDIDAIKASLQEFGFNGALRVKDGTVMAGNQTFAALKSMKDSGAKPPRNVVAKAGDWHVPAIDLAHLSELEAKAFAIADNRTHDRGGEDSAQLAKLLSDLAEYPDLEFASGYTDGDIMELINSLGGDDPKGVEDDNQGKLDTESGIVQCPSCGEEFKP